MSSLRKGNVQAVNFFMFVDILTCVTGIMILFTLLLSTQALGCGQNKVES